jgi:hypothetical protein
MRHIKARRETDIITHLPTYYTYRSRRAAMKKCFCVMSRVLFLASHIFLFGFIIWFKVKNLHVNSLHFFANVLSVHAKEARKIFVSKETLEYLVTFLTRSLVVWFIDWAASRITFMTRLPKISRLKSKDALQANATSDPVQNFYCLHAHYTTFIKIMQICLLCVCCC